MRTVAAFMLSLLLAAALISACGSPSESPRLKSTFEGDPARHSSEKLLVVAVWAPWASAWPTTEEALSGLDPSRFDLQLVNADQERERVQSWGVTIVPTVLVSRRGQQIASVPNPTRLDQLP